MSKRVEEKDSFVERLMEIMSNHSSSDTDLRDSIDKIVEEIFDAGYDEAYRFYGGESLYENEDLEDDDEIRLGYYDDDC